MNSLHKIRDKLALAHTKEMKNKEYMLEPSFVNFCYGFDAATAEIFKLNEEMDHLDYGDLDVLLAKEVTLLEQQVVEANCAVKAIKLKLDIATKALKASKAYYFGIQSKGIFFENANIFYDSAEKLTYEALDKLGESN